MENTVPCQQLLEEYYLRKSILELKPILDIPGAELRIRCIFFEDNNGAEKLAKVPKTGLGSNT